MWKGEQPDEKVSTHLHPASKIYRQMSCSHLGARYNKLIFGVKSNMVCTREKIAVAFIGAATPSLQFS
jgi:hypothetical protein